MPFSPKLTGSTTGYVGTSFPVPLKAKLILPAIGGLCSQQSGKLWGTSTTPSRLRSRRSLLHSSNSSKRGSRRIFSWLFVTG
jgi:hypothetical protein